MGVGTSNISLVCTHTENAYTIFVAIFAFVDSIYQTKVNVW